MITLESAEDTNRTSVFVASHMEGDLRPKNQYLQTSIDRPKQTDEKPKEDSAQASYLTSTIIPVPARHSYKISHNTTASEAVFKAFLKRVQKTAYEKFNANDELGMKPEDVVELIKIANRYVSSLDEYSEYRKFIGIVILMLKANIENLSCTDAKTLISAIERFYASPKSPSDTKTFIRTCNAAGISIVSTTNA